MNEANNTTKRFEDWHVDCNDCGHYWDNSCDGVSRGSRRRCESFIATRSVIIPSQIKSLQRAVKSLRTSHILLCIAVGLMGVMHLIKILEAVGVLP